LRFGVGGKRSAGSAQSFSKKTLRKAERMKPIITSFLITACCLCTATAQDWAKAKVEKSRRHLEWIDLKRGDRKLACYVGYPEVKEKATAVLVIHEIFGLGDWIRNVVDEFAEAGYIAIAPDLLSGSAPKGGGTAELGSRDEVTRTIRTLPPDQITADLNAALEYVSKLPACNGKVVVAGFCWGGAQTFRFATNNKEVKAAFVFYGTGPETEDEIARITCPVYGFYGENDNRVDATIPKTTEQMKKAGKTYEAVTYSGAGHGFMRSGEQPDANAADKKARDEAWTRLKELLKKI
jgi:carboxymethylenebutenolidase